MAMSDTTTAAAGAAAADLSGRRVLVTGGASGIGAACARRFADAGAHVTVLDRDGDGAARVADEIGGCSITVDLSDGDGLHGVADSVDVLVNNAGLQHVAPLEEFPPERFAMILAVMLEAPFRLLRAALPGMYARGYGRIVNISSVHGLRASPYKSAYVAAKHGLEGLSKVAALEGGPKGVTSNCICPAYVRTPLVEGQIAAQRATPRHRRGRGRRADHAHRAGDQAPHRARRGRRPRGLPVLAPGGVHQRGVADHGRRLDRPLSGVKPSERHKDRGSGSS